MKDNDAYGRWFSLPARSFYSVTYPELKYRTLIPMSNIARYHVVHGNTNTIVESFTTEADAIAHAERHAQQRPEIDFVVMKSISKSRATKPVETTRF